MTDEKFVYISDQKEKKRTARGSHNRRTHAGAGGKVRFPSDYMTTKERNAMNGEVKAYRLNEPMTWKEFKSMPDDLQVVYMTAMQERYDPSTYTLSQMFGIHHTRVSAWQRDHGKGKGKGAKCHFQKEAWEKWLAGGKEQTEPVEVITETAQNDTETEKTSPEYVGGCEKQRPKESIVHAIGVIEGITYGIENDRARTALTDALKRLVDLLEVDYGEE